MAMKPRQDNFDDTPAPAPVSANVNNNPGNLEKIVQAGIENIKNGAKGDQNRTLNVTCYWIGRVLGEAALQDVVEKALCDAGVEVGLNSDDAARTARSGLRGGAGAGAPGSEEKLPQFLCEILFVDEKEASLEASPAEILGKLPPLPLEAFPEEIRHAISVIATNKGVSPDMVGVMFLSLASACIGRAREVQYDSTWSEAANLYVLIAAGSGKGKSPTQNLIFSDLWRLEAIQKAQYKEKRRKYEEQMTLFRKKSKKGGEGVEKEEMPQRPPNIQYILDDSTIEAAVERLADNPRGMVWLVDEFYGFFQSLDRFSGSKGGVGEGKRKILSAWSGKTVSLSRRAQDGMSNELYVENATISISGCIQTSLLPKVFSVDDFRQGVVQRFLFVFCPPQPPVQYPTPEIDAKTCKLITKITNLLLGLAMEIDDDGRANGVKIGLDGPARRVFDDFHTAIEANTHETPMVSWAQKIVGSTLRIALVLHYMRAACNGDVVDTEITFSDMTDAIALSDYFFAHAQKMQTLMPKTKDKETPDLEADDLDRRIGEALFCHAAEIAAADCVVSLKQIKAWLAEAEIKIPQNQLVDVLKRLKISAVRTASQRGWAISTESLRIIEKMGAPVRGVFETPEDEEEGGGGGDDTYDVS